MADRHIKSILELKNFAIADGGHGIEFRFSYKTGESEAFSLRADLLPQIMAGLAQAGKQAQIARSVGPQDQVELGTPLIMKSVIRTGQTSDGAIVLNFAATDGFPMSIAMPRDQAQRTIEFLRDEIERPIPMKPSN
jgi:hypothetical protein